MLILWKFYVNLYKNHQKIFLNFRTDKHIKSIVRNLTKYSIIKINVKIINRSQKDWLNRDWTKIYHLVVGALLFDVLGVNVAPLLASLVLAIAGYVVAVDLLQLVGLLVLARDLQRPLLLLQTLALIGAQLGVREQVLFVRDLLLELS